MLVEYCFIEYRNKYSLKSINSKELENGFLEVYISSLFILWYDIVETSKVKMLLLGGLFVISTVLANKKGEKKVFIPKRPRKSKSQGRSPKRRKPNRKLTYPTQKN